MGSLRKKTIHDFDSFKKSAEPFTNATFHKANMVKDVNEEALGILTHAQFERQVLDFIEGKNVEREKMNEYVKYHGWYERHTGKGEASKPGVLKAEYERLKNGQAMHEHMNVEEFSDILEGGKVLKVEPQIHDNQLKVIEVKTDKGNLIIWPLEGTGSLNSSYNSRV